MTQEQFESTQEQLDQDLQADNGDDGNDMLSADDFEDDDPISLQQEAQANSQVSLGSLQFFSEQLFRQFYLSDDL